MGFVPSVPIFPGSTVTNRTVSFDRAIAPFGEIYDNFGSASYVLVQGMTQDEAPSNGLLDYVREYHPGEGRLLEPSGVGWNPYLK